MWQAFVTGFAKQATVDIQERNKEIKKMIQQTMIDREKQNEEVKKKADKDLELRYSIGRRAQSLLSNLNMSENEKRAYTIAFVENPERYAQFEEAVAEGRVGADSVGDFVVLPKTQMDKVPTLEDVYGGFKAKPRAGAQPADYSQMKGAFGLPAERVARAAETEASTALGMTTEERMGLEYETPAPKLGAQFNFNALLKEDKDSLDKRLNKASLSLLDAKTEEEAKQARAELERVLSVKALQKQKEEGGAKESDIRSNYRILNESIMLSMAGPGDLVRDPETNVLMYSRTARPEVRSRIEAQKRKAFENSELTRSYRLPDGTLPPEVSRIISAFTYTVPETKTPSGDRGATPAPAAPAAPTATPTATSATSATSAKPTAADRQQTIANAKDAIKKINENDKLSRGQKNGKLSIIRQRLREAGIDPKEAGL